LKVQQGMRIADLDHPGSMGAPDGRQGFGNGPLTMCGDDFPQRQQ
jgi:hypothetical protein